MNIRWLGALALATGITVSADAQELGPLDWDRAASPLEIEDADQDFLIRSDILGEYREITVRLPANYDRESARYPVYYIVDADWNFPVMAAQVDLLRYFEHIPPAILVGIRNVDRNRDFVAVPASGFPNTGGAAEFIRFVADELKPAIEDRYRTSGFDIIAGHSFGGTITLNFLFERADLFDGYIALSPSNWIADRMPFEQAEAFFADQPSVPLFVYMAVAEADGGATVPDGQAMADLFEARAAGNIDWSYHVFPETNHFSVVAPAFADAIEKLYPGWNAEDALARRIETEGMAAIEAWFSDERARLGDRFYPRPMEMMLLGYELAGAGQGPVAHALMDLLRDRYPRSPEIFLVSSHIADLTGDLEAAIAFDEQAIEVGIREGYAPNRIASFRRRRQLLTDRLQATPPDAE